MKPISSDIIASIEAKKHDLAAAMASGDVAPDEFVRLSKEYAEVEPVAAAATTGPASGAQPASSTPASGVG